MRGFLVLALMLELVLGVHLAAEAAYGVAPASKFKGEVRRAYEAASRSGAVAQKLFCYCGCDHEGHSSLLSCFQDDHGVGCSICRGEMLDADVMKRKGMSTKAIRDAIDKKWSPSYPHPEPTTALKRYQARKKSGV